MNTTEFGLMSATPNGDIQTASKDSSAPIMNGTANSIDAAAAFYGLNSNAAAGAGDGEPSPAKAVGLANGPTNTATTDLTSAAETTPTKPLTSTPTPTDATNTDTATTEQATTDADGTSGTDGQSNGTTDMNGESEAPTSSKTGDKPIGSVPQVLNYNDAFPSLGGGGAPGSGPTGGGAWGAGGPRPNMPKLKSKVVTQVFHLPVEERRHQDDGTGAVSAFEDRSEQQKCNEIMKHTGSKIELCESKDHSLTIVVSGERHAVEEARKLIVQKLQTSMHRDIPIPKEHHRVLIGKEGKRLAELERMTDCRILVPGRDMPSDVIRISGPKEGIERAAHQIQFISDEQSKMAQEVLTIPRVFYPWIRGPNNENVDAIARKTGARINIPPPSVASERIVITGEKEGVYAAADELKRIFADKEKTCQTVSIQVLKTQHRFVIGPSGSALAEILRETGVSVEVPPTDSDSDTLTLRGPPDALGQALVLVYAKASSVITDEVECPQWLHKFIIGPRGSNIKAIIGDPPTVQVNFEDEGSIFLEGPPEEVKRAKASLSELSTKLEEELALEVIKVHPQFHRHIIGKGGSNIAKIKDETGVLVSVPDESTNSDEIRLEGKKDGVARAREMIVDISSRMENEKSRDIIIEQRFHRLLIGTRGEAVRDLREQFPGINVSFPESGRKSDVVTIRGPKEEVDRCFKKLTTTAKEMAENNHQVKLPIFKDFRKFIIGKGGQNIRKIRDETDTRIEIPNESSQDDITITGKRPNVEKARDMLTKIQNDLASVVSLECPVPQKVHSSLLMGGGRLIHSIQEECGGVNIKFPAEKEKSDKVIIRGPKDDAQKAKDLLQKLARDKEVTSHTAEVKAKPEHHRFIIGRGGSTINKIREGHPDIRILFPRPQDQDQDVIHLIGREKDVAAVKTQLETMLEELKNTVEDETQVDPKHHRHFVQRQGAILREIQDSCGGLMISFPRMGSNSNVVVLKGPKEGIDDAKKRIAEIVGDLDAQVTIRAEIPQKYHSVLLKDRGSKIQEVTTSCQVQIKFPDRQARGPPPPRAAAGGPEENADGGASPEPPAPIAAPVEENTERDFVIITGRKERCEKAEAMLRDMIPISQSMEVPFAYHRYLIGTRGAELRNLMQDHDVNISIPPRELQKDEITVSGRQENVDQAIAAIHEKVQGYKDEEQDRELRAFRMTMPLQAAYHSKIIGARGTTINKLRDDHKVQITIPPAEAENKDEIILQGYEKNCQECKEAIEKMLEDFAALVTQEITLDCRTHGQMIGLKRRNIRKIMDTYNVDIQFPRMNDPDPNLVTITGSDEDQIYDCIDHLRNLEEEYLQDVTERYRHPQFEPSDRSGSAQKQSGFVLQGAPWDGKPPDTSDMEAFPTMALGGSKEGSPAADAGGDGSSPVPPPAPPTSSVGFASAWGAKRKI